MKKFVVVIMVLIVIITLTSCGASWEQMKKNWKADIGGGLVRKVVVINMLDNSVIWEYEGKCYIADGSVVGDITIVYYNEFGESKKADFIGRFYGVSSVEI